MMGGTVFNTVTATAVVAVAAVVALMLAVVPVEGSVRCYANDVLPSGASFTSPNLTVDLKDCTDLQLYLGNTNDIGDIGATALAEALKGNTELTDLNLWYNNIGDIGATALAEAIKGNTALTYLGLRGNNIGDIGAAAFAEVLKGNTVLTTLYLSFNNIGDIGARAIVEALKGNTALATLLMSNNNNISCSNHGTLREYGNDVNVVAGRLCDCSGIWSGDLCETNVPGKTALTVVFSIIALLALVYAAVVVNRKYNLPYKARRQAELAFGREHPIIVSTLGGDSYTLEDWGHCKDLKVMVQKLAQETGLGDLGSFALLDNDGWFSSSSRQIGQELKKLEKKYYGIIPMAIKNELLARYGKDPKDEVTDDGIDATSTEVDTEYGSTHRANIMQSHLLQGGGGIELTLVYNAGGGGSVLLARTPPILKKASETAV